MTVWLVALTILLPWSGALAVLADRDRHPRAQNALAITAVLAGAVASLALIPGATNAVVLRFPYGGVFGDLTFVPDGLGVLLAVIASVVGSITVIYSADYMRGDPQLGRYYALVLLFIGAMCGLALTGSLLLLFLFWELVAVCSYALISFHNDDSKAVAGGIKALVITQIGGIGLLAGALMVYAYLGNYQIADLLANAGRMPPTMLAIVAFGFLIAAAAKSAQVPFHTWLPGAMEAPSPVSALIHAATMVNAGVYLLARFYPAFAAVPGWTTMVIAVGVISTLLAGLMALVATDLKRVLAYSTISQLGYMVFAVGCGAIFAAQFHLLSHALFKALLFLAAGTVIHTVGTRDIRQMGGLGQRMLFVQDAFLIGGLALMGVPVLNGFWSKELILEAGPSAGWLPYALMLGGVFLTALYTTRVIVLVFFGKPRSDLPTHEVPLAMVISLVLLMVGTIVSWLMVEGVGQLLSATLPLHQIEIRTLGSLVSEVIVSPGTVVALCLTGLGALVWWKRTLLLPPTRRWLDRLSRLAEADFGFEALNALIVSAIRKSVRTLRLTQTGHLNWNVAGIVIGLIIVLGLLVFGRPL